MAAQQNEIAARQEQNAAPDIAKADVSPAAGNPSTVSSPTEYSLASKPASASRGSGALVTGSSAASVMRSDAQGGGAAFSGSGPGIVEVTPRVNRIASPDGSVVWYFGNNGVIVRTENSAPRRVMNSGIKRDLLAASAPSNDVCWMVGQSGAIVRTLDVGAHWRIVKPPSRADFTAVSAMDSNNATVVALDRHRFVTHDGGVTWSPP
jgi:hypothetical protein